MNSSELSHNFAEGQKIDDEEIKNQGGWTYHQKLLYVVFLDINKAIMISRKKRKNFKIFDKMAEFITTRDSLQCRSHHQKILEKFLDIKQILTYFKRSTNPEDYRRYYNFHSGKKQRTSKCLKPTKKLLQQVPPIKFQDAKEGPILKLENIYEKNIQNASIKQKEILNVEEEYNSIREMSQNQKMQFGILNMPSQYLLRYCYEGYVNPMIISMGGIFLLSQPQLSLF